MRMGSRARAGALPIMAAVLAVGLGCSRKAPPEAALDSKRPDSSTIYAVNYPLSYFAERMAPAGVRVVFPVPEGIDPAFWKPSAEAVQEYQRASLILLNGAGYARWTRYATLPRTRIVITADGCRDRFLPSDDIAQHQHGPEGAHAHTGLAFTTWLDLRLAACQAGRIRDALVERWPEEKANISDKLESLERDLLDLDERLRKVGKALGERPLLASHPVYQYLADAYGLSIQSLHLEPDQVLSDDDWKEIDAMLNQHRAKWMLWEAPPLEATEVGLRARGVTPVVFDPAAQRPSEGDFMTVMKANVDRLECATGIKACP
jgi:zinc transport system substrate-binding protein